MLPLLHTERVAAERRWGGGGPLRTLDAARLRRRSVAVGAHTGTHRVAERLVSWRWVTETHGRSFTWRVTVGFRAR